MQAENFQKLETSSQLEDMVDVIYPYPVLLILAKSCLNTEITTKPRYISTGRSDGQESSDLLVEGWGTMV